MNLLVIDDMWDSNEILFEKSPDFRGAKLTGFTNVSEAIDYLRTVDIKDYPNTCIVDAIFSLFGQGIAFADTNSGLDAALALERFFKSKNYTDVRYIFKSADRNKALAVLEEFSRLRPDCQAGTFTSHGPDFLIDKDGYEPPSIPEMAKKFMAQASELDPMQVFDALRGEPIRHLHAVWDDLADVSLNGDEEFFKFSYGSGAPKSGKVVRSLEDIRSLPGREKAIFVCDNFPEGILYHARNLSAIVIVGKYELPGHLRLLLKPMGISLLAGAHSDIPEDFSGQVTVHPIERKLYRGSLNIIDMSQTMSRFNTYIEEMEAVARDRMRRSSVNQSHFRVNISGHDDNRTTLFSGLTRTEQFCSPYVNSQAFAKMRDFLIGKGADLRRIFNLAGERYADLPFISLKKDRYEQEFILIAPLPLIAGSFDPEDVIRLLDIPVEEFFSEEDQGKYRQLYGDARGVQLARHVPDMYVKQLRMLAGIGRFHSYGLPLILIPAVQCADDIAFVKECAAKALPEKFTSGFRAIKFGAMIDSKLAYENIEQISQSVSHISIGSNDLTADLLKISRQDPRYVHNFSSLPKEMISILADILQKARDANPDVTISLCGEACADLETLKALKSANIYFDYFSVPSTFKDTRLLPLAYNDFLLHNFCGPLEAEDENFYLEPRGRSDRPSP